MREVNQILILLLVTSSVLASPEEQFTKYNENSDESEWDEFDENTEQNEYNFDSTKTFEQQSKENEKSKKNRESLIDENDYEIFNEIYLMMLASLKLKENNYHTFIDSDVNIVEESDEEEQWYPTKIFERWSKQKDLQVIDDNFCKNYELMVEWLNKEFFKKDFLNLGEIDETMYIEAFKKTYISEKLLNLHKEYVDGKSTGQNQWDSRMRFEEREKKVGETDDGTINEIYLMLLTWSKFSDFNLSIFTEDSVDDDIEDMIKGTEVEGKWYSTKIFEQWSKQKNFIVIDDDFWNNYMLAEEWLDQAFFKRYNEFMDVVSDIVAFKDIFIIAELRNLHDEYRSGKGNVEKYSHSTTEDNKNRLQEIDDSTFIQIYLIVLMVVRFKEYKHHVFMVMDLTEDESAVDDSDDEVHLYTKKLIELMRKKFGETDDDFLNNYEFAVTWLREQFLTDYIEHIDEEMKAETLKKIYTRAKLLSIYDDYIGGKRNIENIWDLKEISEKCLKKDNDYADQKWNEEYENTDEEVNDEEHKWRSEDEL